MHRRRLSSWNKISRMPSASVPSILPESTSRRSRKKRSVKTSTQQIRSRPCPTADRWPRAARWSTNRLPPKWSDWKDSTWRWLRTRPSICWWPSRIASDTAATLRSSARTGRWPLSQNRSAVRRWRRRRPTVWWAIGRRFVFSFGVILTMAQCNSI